MKKRLNAVSPRSSRAEDIISTESEGSISIDKKIDLNLNKRKRETPQQTDSSGDIHDQLLMSEEDAMTPFDQLYPEDLDRYLLP